MPDMPQELIDVANKADSIIAGAEKKPEDKEPDEGLPDERPAAIEPDVQVLMDVMRLTEDTAEELLEAAKSFPATSGMDAKALASWMKGSYENFANLAMHAKAEGGMKKRERKGEGAGEEGAEVEEVMPEEGASRAWNPYSMR